jgi:hypothetical protein
MEVGLKKQGILLGKNKMFTFVSVLYVPSLFSLLYLFWNKKFWEELISYFPQKLVGDTQTPKAPCDC